MKKLFFLPLLMVGLFACVNNGNDPNAGPTEGNLYEEPAEVYEDYDMSYDNIIRYESEADAGFAKVINYTGEGKFGEAALDAEKLVDVLYGEDRYFAPGSDDADLNKYRRFGRLPYLLKKEILKDTNMVKQVYFYDRAYQARELLRQANMRMPVESNAEKLADPTAVRPGTQGGKSTQTTFVPDDRLNMKLPHISAAAEIIKNAAKRQDAIIAEDAAVAVSKLQAIGLQVKSGTSNRAEGLSQALAVVEQMMLNQEDNYRTIEKNLDTTLQPNFEDYSAYSKELYYKVRDGHSETAETVGGRSEGTKSTENYEDVNGVGKSKNYKGKEQIQ